MSASSGCLALTRSTLFVGTHAKTASVRGFDLGGRELAFGLSFRDSGVGRSAVSGLVVDEDHALWIADPPADRVRRFSLFGREIGGLGHGPTQRPALLPGSLHRPVDVELQDGLVVVGCAGESPHAVQFFDPERAYHSRCSALGEPGRCFRGVTRLAASGARLYVAESLARRIQVFRRGEFHFAFQLADVVGRYLEPCAVAALPDGRSVVACRDPLSTLVLVDGSGRLLRVLAQHGEQEGTVFEPSDVVVEQDDADRRARLFVLDRDGTRLQVFTLEGRCLGSIPLESRLQARSGRDRRNSARRREKGGR